MAHVIHSINVTVGGSCDHTEAVADEEHHRYALDLLTSADAVLFGRNTFDLFASFWPAAADKADLPFCMTSFDQESCCFAMRLERAPPACTMAGVR